MAKPDASQHAETITLSRAELDSAIARGVAAALATRPDLGPVLTQDERVAAQLKQDRPEGTPVDYVPCISRTELGGTGARFIAVVTQDRIAAKGRVVPGRVVNLVYYTRPDRWMKMLPRGIVPINQQSGLLTSEAKKLLWEMYWKRDSIAIVGHALNQAMRMTSEERAAATFAIGVTTTGAPAMAPAASVALPPPGHGVGCTGEFAGEFTDETDAA